MTQIELAKAGPRRALIVSTVAFTVCFAVWTIFSIIGISLKDKLGLSETQYGLLVGTPVLTGSLIRIVLGIWTDRRGGRLVYTLTMLAAAVATFLLAFAQTYEQLLVAALGVAIVLCFAIGWILGYPALRVQHHYLAFVTLAFSTLMFLVFRNEDWLTKGIYGISNIPRPHIFGFPTNRPRSGAVSDP